MTLINYMETVEESEVALKDETMYGLGATSVSWHSDSSLRKTRRVRCITRTGAEEKRLVRGVARVKRRVSGASRAFGRQSDVLHVWRF